MNLRGLFLQLVKGGIDSVKVFAVHLFHSKAQSFAKALEVHHFPLTQKANDIVHIRVVRQAQNIVIGGARLLLSAHILGQVGNHIALYGD